MKARFYTLTAILLTLAVFSVTSFPNEVLGAEIAVDTTTLAVLTDTANSASPQAVWTSDQTGFVFYIGAEGDLEMASTTDGGATWAVTNRIDSVNFTDVVDYSIWYDGWTAPGTTTTYIHIVTVDSSADDLHYTRFNLNTNSTSTTIQVTGPVVSCVRNNSQCSGTITKATDNVLYMAGSDTSGNWMMRCSSNCTNAGNWSQTAAIPIALGNDYAALTPVGGNNNVLLTLWDSSADTIYSWMYSATTSSFSATSTIGTTKNDNGVYDAGQMGMAFRMDTGLTALAALDDVSVFADATHDINFWTFATTSGWTARTNPITNAAGSLNEVKVSFDETNDAWYVIYSRRTTASASTTSNVYYKSSTDNGVTWSAESSAVNDNTDAIQNLTTGIMSPERIGAWWKYTTSPRASDEYYDLVADITAGGGGDVVIIEDIYFLQ